jgi:serine protease
MGGTANLTWSTTNASSCTATGGWTGSRPTSGSESVANLRVSTTFTLACTNAGVTVSTAVSIDVRPVPAPAVTLDVTPRLVRRGERVTVAWSATNADQCRADWLGPFGDVPTTGTSTIDTSTLLGGPSGVRLQCFGPSGDTSVSRTFDVAMVAGTIVTPLGVLADTDINDPNAPYESNDTTSRAIPIPDFGWTPGYVNVAGAGPAGRSFATGDVRDYFRISPSRTGIVLRLRLPTVDEAAPVGARDDADLYLYDSTGTLLDAAVGTGATEVLALPGRDNYLIEVRAVRGGMNYLLSAEDSIAPTALTPERLTAEFVSGEAIVTVRGGAAATPDAAARRLSQSGYFARAGEPGREQRMLLPLTTRARALSAAPDSTRVPAALEARLATLLQLKALRARSDVAAADLNRVVQADALVPTDPLYDRQRWHYELLNAPTAWDISTGANSVIVAIVDSGVVITHPDLQPKLEPGYDFVSDPNGLDRDGLDGDPSDPGFDSSGQWVFHGTHVAGTVGAAANNGVGGVGVSWNARLMPLRVLDGRAGTTYDVLQAVRFAAGLLRPRISLDT